MFNQSVIDRKVEKHYHKTGQRLIEHPVDECIKIYEHFLKIETPDGKKRKYGRELEQWEKEWASNEMHMCACSFPYWYYRYFFIKTKEGRIQRPDVLVAQQIFLDILSDLDKAHKPIVMMILKARQLGMSTITEAVILWIALFRRGSHTVIASAEEQKSIEMSEMVWIGLENLPLYMMPRLTREDRKIGPEFGDISSDVLIQHGSMSKGISRGSNPIAAHISEAAFYPDPVETLESSLLRAMHENKRTFLVLESTARKKGDWWNKTWDYNREAAKTGTNKYVCIFFPWYVGHDKYPTEGWMLNHPIPDGWTPLKKTEKQALDAKLYVKTTPLLRKYLGDKWEMPRKQMWFWEFEFLAASRDDTTLKMFYREMAASEREAFQSARWSVFTQETLDRVKEEMNMDYKDYVLVGSGIDKRFNLTEFQGGGKRHNIRWMSNEGQEFSWQLIPLKTTPEDDNLDYYVRIWKLPQKGYKYSLGIDISGGVGQDSTAVKCIEVGQRDEPDEEVAEIVTPWLNSLEIVPYCHALGVFYGQYMSPVAEALMAPETQVAVGDPISFELDKLGYTNFHYMQRKDLRKAPGQRPTRRGWATLSYTRQSMLDLFKHGVDYGWLKINSERTFDELENFESEEMDSGKIKFEHASGENDDNIFGLSIAYQVSHDKDTMMERMAGKLKPKKPRDKKTDDFEGMDTMEVMLARHFQREDSEEAGYDSYDPERMSNVY